MITTYIMLGSLFLWVRFQRRVLSLVPGFSVPHDRDPGVGGGGGKGAPLRPSSHRNLKIAQYN